MPATDYARAVCYARVSTLAQSGDNHWSLPVQQQRYQDACKTNRWEPIGEYVDVDSGRKNTRKNYQRLLADARSGQLDVIIVQFLDRFGRNPREILRRYWELEELGVSVIVTDEDVKEEIVLLIRAAMAGKESERISQRVIPTMEAVILSGRWPGGAPYGYQLIQDKSSPDRGHLIIDESEADVVRRVFDLYSKQNIGWAKIAGLLNSEGVKSPRNGLWWASTVQYLLTNLTYVGRLHWRGHEVACPSLISEEQFVAVQDLIERRKLAAVRLGPDTSYLLQGLVRCACGIYRHCWTAHRSNRPDPDGYHHPPHRYYRCARQAQQRTCHVGLVDADEIETWLRDQFRNWTLPEHMRAPASEPSHGDTTTRQREAIQSKIERYRQRLSRSYDARMDGEISKEDYQTKRDEYLAAITDAENELAQLARQPRAIDLTTALAKVTRFAADIAFLSPAELRSELAEMIECVDVTDRHTFRLIPRPEFVSLLT